MENPTTEDPKKKLADDAKLLQENAAHIASGLREDATILGENVAQVTSNLREDIREIGERLGTICIDIVNVAGAEVAGGVTATRRFLGARPVALFFVALAAGCFLGSRRTK